jgi:hypothetical protein
MVANRSRYSMPATKFERLIAATAHISTAEISDHQVPHFFHSSLVFKGALP